MKQKAKKNNQHQASRASSTQKPKKFPNNIRLGIWGLPGSGKSNFLTMLLNSILEWNEDIEGEKLYSIRFKNKQSRLFLRNNFRTIFGKSTLIGRTDTTQELKIMTYILEINNEEKQQLTLEFLDAPGGFYQNFYKSDDGNSESNNSKDSISEVLISDEDKTENSDNNKYSNIIEYLSQCHGIFILLDPDIIALNREEKYQYQESLRDMFFEFQAEFDKQKQEQDKYTFRIPQYLAFCVTKIDRESFWHIKDDAKNLTKKILGENILNFLQSYCFLDEKNNNDLKKNRCKFFSVSAIGRYYKKDEEGNESWREAVATSSENPSENEQHSYDQTEGDFGNPINSNNEQNSNPNRILPPEDGETLRPYQLIDSLKWLIDSVSTLPPSLPSRRSERQGNKNTDDTSSSENPWDKD